MVLGWAALGPTAHDTEPQLLSGPVCLVRYRYGPLFNSACEEQVSACRWVGTAATKAKQLGSAERPLGTGQRGDQCKTNTHAGSMHVHAWNGGRGCQAHIDMHTQLHTHNWTYTKAHTCTHTSGRGLHSPQAYPESACPWQGIAQATACCL